MKLWVIQIASHVLRAREKKTCARSSERHNSIMKKAVVAAQRIRARTF